jgi:hypothetical protein
MRHEQIPDAQLDQHNPIHDHTYVDAGAPWILLARPLVVSAERSQALYSANALHKLMPPDLAGGFSKQESGCENGDALGSGWLRGL